MVMDKRDYTERPSASKKDFEAAFKASYSNALTKCYDGQKLALEMFFQGIKFERTREIPELTFD